MTEKTLECPHCKKWTLEVDCIERRTGIVHYVCMRCKRRYRR